VTRAGELVLVGGRDPARFAGGTESYTVAQAFAAQAAGLRPHVVVLRRRGGVVEAPFGTVHRVATPVHPVRSLTSVLQRPWLVPAIVDLLRDRPGRHVIHSFGAWVDTAVQASRALARLGVEAIPVATAFTTIEHEAVAKLESRVVQEDRWRRLVQTTEVLWARNVTMRVERHGYRAAHEVLVNYESVRGLLEAAFGTGLTIRRVTYAPATAFDPRAEDPEPPLPAALADLGDPRAPLVVAVSRHDGRKGMDVLIRALALLRDAGVPFRACLAGTGVLLDDHRRLVTRLGLDDRVRLPGRVPEAMPVLRHADVFVLPSHEEGSGAVSVLEALQAGTAVVASDVDGLPEDVRHRRDGLLVAPGQETALRDALAHLLGDPELRSDLGAAARRRFEERFSAERAVQEARQTYGALGLLTAPAAAMTPATRATSSSVTEGPEGR
jgi:glycosyltransferase involved in cell wall biosynthesis